MTTKQRDLVNLRIGEDVGRVLDWIAKKTASNRSTVFRDSVMAINDLFDAGRIELFNQFKALETLPDDTLILIQVVEDDHRNPRVKMIVVSDDTLVQDNDLGLRCHPHVVDDQVHLYLELSNLPGQQPIIIRVGKETIRIPAVQLRVGALSWPPKEMEWPSDPRRDVAGDRAQRRAAPLTAVADLASTPPSVLIELRREAEPLIQIVAARVKRFVSATGSKAVTTSPSWSGGPSRSRISEPREVQRHHQPRRPVHGRDGSGEHCVRRRPRGAPQSRVNYLSDQPWWTAADRAELEAIVYQLVESLTEHRAYGCETCAAGYPPCPRVQKAIGIVIEWREARMVLSRAKWERMRQNTIEFERELDKALGWTLRRDRPRRSRSLP